MALWGVLTVCSFWTWRIFHFFKPTLSPPCEKHGFYFEGSEFSRVCLSTQEVKEEGKTSNLHSVKSFFCLWFLLENNTNKFLGGWTALWRGKIGFEKFLLALIVVVGSKPTEGEAVVMSFPSHRSVQECQSKLPAISFLLHWENILPHVLSSPLGEKREDSARCRGAGSCALLCTGGFPHQQHVGGPALLSACSCCSSLMLSPGAVPNDSLRSWNRHQR